MKTLAIGKKYRGPLWNKGLYIEVVSIEDNGYVVRHSPRRNGKRKCEIMNERAIDFLEEFNEEKPKELECCNGCGGDKTFKNQCPMPIGRRVRNIDKCIALIVAALNSSGIETIASCCGHGKQKGRIDLIDGRVLFIEKEGG